MKDGRYVVVFYNKMFSLPWEFDELTFPDDFIVTPDHDYLDEADAVVFHLPTMDPELKLRKKPGQLWVYWCMECDDHYPILRAPEILSMFDLFMTYKSDADIPVWYLDYRELPFLRKPPVKKDKLVNAFISSRLDRSRRKQYLSELMSYMPVDSYGKVCNNKSIENDTGWDSKLEIISAYKFSLAFENTIQKDYVTEKFFEPLIAGSVPVYMGAPNIEEYAPGDHCFINVNSFSGPAELAEYLQMLDGNDVLYQQYLQWKGLDFRPAFVRKWENQREHYFVRLCHAVKECLIEKVSY